MFTTSQFFQSAQEKLPAKFTLLIIFALFIFPQLPLIPMAYSEFWLDAGMIAGLNMAAVSICGLVETSYSLTVLSVRCVFPHSRRPTPN